MMTKRASFDGLPSGQNRSLLKDVLTCRIDRFGGHSNLPAKMVPHIFDRSYAIRFRSLAAILDSQPDVRFAQKRTFLRRERGSIAD
jgi:hypothetical protein